MDAASLKSDQIGLNPANYKLLLLDHIYYGWSSYYYKLRPLWTTAANPKFATSLSSTDKHKSYQALSLPVVAHNNNLIFAILFNSDVLRLKNKAMTTLFFTYEQNAEDKFSIISIL